jgi:hypothetical protein
MVAVFHYAVSARKGESGEVLSPYVNYNLNIQDFCSILPHYLFTTTNN